LFFLVFSSLLSGCLLLKPASPPPAFALSEADARRAGALALYAKGLLYDSGEGSDTNTAKEAALEAYRQAVCLDPDNRRPLASLILNLSERERYGEALAALDAFLARYPDDLEFRLEAARLADVADRPADAARHCAHILKVQPDNRELAQALIRLHFQSGQDAQAFRLMRAQQKRFHDGASAALPVQWAIHFTREGQQPARALACLDLALPLRTNAVERSSLITLVAETQLELGRTNAAVASLQKAYRECPSLTTPLLRLGAVWAARPDGTNRLARQARREKAPDTTLLILAAAQQALDNPTAAVATLKDVYDRQKRAGHFPDESFCLWFGSLLEETKAADEAERFFSEALAAHPASHEMKNYLAYTWSEKSMRLDDAERLINEALSVLPDNAAYLDTKGWVLFKKARYYDAVQLLLKAAETDKDEPVILDHAGDALFAIGREPEAVAFWTRSHQLAPAPAVADKLRRHGAKPSRK
jgi:tetratricopeptide (TPR) repeat protein